MKLIPFQGLFPKMDLIADSDSFFGNTKYRYPKFNSNGFFDKDPSEALYLYHVENPYGTHFGLIVTLDIMDFLDDKVLEHEKTLAAKEQEQLQLTLERNAFIKPVLVGFKSFPAFDEFVKEKMKEDPDQTVRLKKKKELHKFWKISDGEQIERIIKQFEEHVPQTYIADGHHRCSIARILWYQSSQKMINLKMESLLTVLMPLSQLKIHDFNRVVELGELDYFSFMAHLSKYFKIKSISQKAKPNRKYKMTMIMADKWFELSWKKSVLKKYGKKKHVLDYFLLNEFVMRKILNIPDIRDHDGIYYVPGVDKFKGMINAISKMENAVGFMLYPMEMKEVCYYADNKMVLPPKSSYFLPRVVNGMIVQELK